MSRSESSDRGALNLEARTGAGRSEHMQPGMFPFEAFEFDSPLRSSDPALRVQWRIALDNLPTTDPADAGVVWLDGDGILRVSGG